MKLLFLALALTLAASPAAAMRVTIDEQWGATSQLWEGRYLAICVQPGAPSPFGTYYYTIDPHTSHRVGERELRALALTDHLSKSDRQAVALAAIAHDGITDLPPWARLAERGVRATVYRSRQAQDILVVSIPPPAFEPPGRYAYLGGQSSAWGSGWWGGNRTWWGGSRGPGVGATGGPGGTNYVPEPPAWTLIPIALAVITIMRRRAANR